MLTLCTNQPAFGHLSILLTFFIFGLASNYVAYKRDFFSLPSSFDSRTWPIKNTVICLAIYLLVTMLISPLITKGILKILNHDPTMSMRSRVSIMMILQSITTTLTIVGLGLFLFYQKRSTVKSIWRDPLMKRETTVIGDFVFGALTWFLSFPVVAVVNHVCELINKYIFRVKEVDQVAVRYLKTAKASPFAFAIALVAIIVAAPFIEEFIFRGCIQNTLRKLTNSKCAIVLSALIFAFFHFSIAQGASNFPLITTLFSFALYLGFLYEKRRSLFANISLHMTFNAISVLRIIF